MRVLSRALMLAAVAACALAPTLSAQGVTYRSTTKLEMGGAMGALARMGARAGGMDEGTTTYIDGHRMATDSKNAGSIVDVDAGRFITINKREKTYTSMTFEEMAQFLAQLERSAQEARNEEAAKEKAAPETKLEYQLAVDRTAERQKIAGYDAQRQFITLTMTATPTDPKAKADPNAPQGNMVVLMDVWTTTDGPAAEATREFHRAYAAMARAEMQSPMRGLAVLLGNDPGAKAALTAAGKELSKLQGLALRSSTYIVSVPQGQQFDRQKLLAAGAQAAEKKEEKKGGFLSRMKAAAEQVQQDKAQEGQPGPAVQKSVLSFTTEVQDIQSGVPAGAFEIPAGFKEVKPEQPRS